MNYLLLVSVYARVDVGIIKEALVACSRYRVQFHIRLPPKVKVLVRYCSFLWPVEPEHAEDQRYIMLETRA